MLFHSRRPEGGTSNLSSLPHSVLHAGLDKWLLPGAGLGLGIFQSVIDSSNC